MNIKKYSKKEGIIEYVDTETPGDVILFLHGAGVNLRQFEYQISKLSDTFRIVAFSLRGHGNSKLYKEQTSEDMTFPKMREDLIHLMDYLEIDVFNIVGNSAGGVLGLEVLKSCPERLKSLIIYGTAPEIQFSYFVRDMIVNIDKFMLKAGNNVYKNLMVNYSSKYKNTQTLFKSLIEDTNDDTIWQFRKILARYTYVEEIIDTKIPILIIKSKYDKDINKSLNRYEKEFLKNPNVKMIKLEDAGHIANLDNPEEFNKIIRKFIENENKN
ncbi:MAG: alpha/beta hydrolase [Tissierellia bacterium]|jgi:3-oxoadipate enol-lactonase|nr:alpha/beta hydrolase [Tissierellia bacterium]